MNVINFYWVAIFEIFDLNSFSIESWAIEKQEGILKESSRQLYVIIVYFFSLWKWFDDVFGSNEVVLK